MSRSDIHLTVAGILMLALGAPLVHAQKIVCWKDAAGKTVGCGDKVPPEYASGATKELDKQGNVRKTGESVDEMTKRQAREKEQARVKAEEDKRLTEQKRQDSALLDTFSSEKEINLKRDRELLALNNLITQQNAALKVANERLAEGKKGAAATTKEDAARADRDQKRISGDIAANEKAKTDITVKYAEYRKRFAELKGTAPAAEVKAAAPAVAAKK